MLVRLGVLDLVFELVDVEDIGLNSWEVWRKLWWGLGSCEESEWCRVEILWSRWW